MIQSKKPILGFSAHSGTGKTTLIEKLIPELLAINIPIALIKHSHHQFDIDQPGKDSYRLRKAGAVQTLVASKNRWALMVETPNSSNEPNLADLVRQIDCKHIKLILVEGFKHESITKIALHRKSHKQDLSFLSDPNIIAIATDDQTLDTTLKHTHSKQMLDINNVIEIRDFIKQHIEDC
ncbi:MAG: molybdopterin-guanine dinucleotide biosynthesis protein B [Pseudomonadota bacterium]